MIINREILPSPVFGQLMSVGSARGGALGYFLGG